MKKYCPRCKLKKDYSRFPKDKRTSDGLYSICGKCHYQYNTKKWTLKNKEYSKQYKKEHYIAQREYQKNYVIRMRKTSIKYRLDYVMTNAIWTALRQNKKWRKWKDLVGYSSDDLMVHLKSKFNPNMNWGNYGSYWEIDHIKPKSLFKYKTAEDPEFQKCWSLDNLQPLEVHKNRVKGSNFNHPLEKI